MKKVLFLGNDFHAIYYTRRELVRELIKRGNEVYIAIPEDNRNVELTKIGAKCVNLDIDRNGMNPVHDIRYYLNCKNIVKNIQPDIVLMFTIKPNIYGGMICSTMRIPYINTITGLGRIFQTNSWKKNLIILLYRVALKNAKCIFFENTENMQKFIDLNIGNTHKTLLPGAGVNLIENAYEEFPKQKEKSNILFVGRIEEDKGIKELLQAAQILNEKNAKVQFTFVGDYELGFKEYVEQIEIPSNISMEGWKSDVHSYMKEADAIILPSYHEGMANVLLEAAATGRPILASNIHGCIESFEEGVTGFGFARKSVEEIVSVVEKFINLSWYDKKNMGKAGRQRMECRFDRGIVVNEFIKVIEE